MFDTTGLVMLSYCIFRISKNGCVCHCGFSEFYITTFNWLKGCNIVMQLQNCWIQHLFLNNELCLRGFCPSGEQEVLLIIYTKVIDTFCVYFIVPYLLSGPYDEEKLIWLLLFTVSLSFFEWSLHYYQYFTNFLFLYLVTVHSCSKSWTNGEG